MTVERQGVGALPAWRSVVVVVAHPDDESFGFGAVIDTFVCSGAAVGVLCFTHGEASTLHGVAGDLGTVRAAEFAAAARVLAVSSTLMLDYPDGALSDVARDELADHVLSMAVQTRADGVLVFDSSGVTGHPDHESATSAAMAVRTRADGVLVWTLPHPVAIELSDEFGAGFAGHGREEVDLVVTVSRERQLEAIACHPSQAVPSSVLWRRLELVGGFEHLRWLRPPGFD